MGRDGRTTGGGVGAQGTEDVQDWVGYTVGALDNTSETKRNRGGW